MAKKTVSTYQNPLDRYLESDRDGDDDLAFLARQFRNEPFDAKSFRAELEAKLKRLEYQPARGQKKTFYAALKDAGFLEILLDDEAVQQFHESLLLVRICERYRELEHAGKDIYGTPLRERNRQLRRIDKDFSCLEQIRKRLNLCDTDFEKAWEKLNRESMCHLRIILSSTKYRTPRSSLLSDQPPDNRRHKTKEKHQPEARNENVAAKVAIYKTLKLKLQKTEAKGKGLTELFLCQLAELIWADPNVPSLSDGQALYRATRRTPDLTKR